MKIIRMEIDNICECRHAVLNFPSNLQKSSLYLVHSSKKCEIIPLALQLIFGVKYSNSAALHKIRDKIFNGKIKVKFSLLQQSPNKNAGESSQQQDHSSDSDVPCTSQQARQRLKRRLAKRQNHARQKSMVVVNACRDFTSNPDLIVYTVNNGPTIQCSVVLFQIRFFTCTDVIFPRLTNITHGEYCNGRWLDLLSMEFVAKGSDGEKSLKRFCQLYAERKISTNHVLRDLTTSVLTGQSFLNNARISHLINILNDIRWLFEYMTCSEFTVWFLLPTIFGNLQDITKITTENINFDLMKTQIQLKQENATPFPWVQAEKHVQELLMVSVQLAFGYHCQQNIIYLHSLNYLEKHQSFEYLNYSLIQSLNTRQLLFGKNYLLRIFNVCTKLNICCVLEYCGGLPAYPSQGFVISCNWSDSFKEWEISVKNASSNTEINPNAAHNFIQQLEASLE